MLKKNGPVSEKLDFINLHTPDGKPLCINADFFISALETTRDGTSTTEVKIDEGPHIRNINVREGIDDIRHSFAIVSNLILNPKYIAAIMPNNGNNAENFPFVIRLNTPNADSFISSSTPENVMNAVKKAGLSLPR